MKKIYKPIRINNFEMKKKLTLAIDDKIIEQARANGINMSQLFEYTMRNKIVNPVDLHTAEVSGSNPDKPTIYWLLTYFHFRIHH